MVRLLVYTVLFACCTGCAFVAHNILGMGKDNTFVLQKGTHAEKYYEIKRFASGCCGCMAFYYNIYPANNKKAKEAQFVYEVNCGGEPTRFEFRENQSTDTYILVTDSTYEIPLTELDKMLMVKLDSITSSVTTVSKKYKFSELKGWRKANGTDIPHPFIIDK